MKWKAHDATELELPAASFDVVFSNWLLMYLSDDEVSKLATDALRWVRTQTLTPYLIALSWPLQARTDSCKMLKTGICVPVTESKLATNALCWVRTLASDSVTHQQSTCVAGAIWATVYKHEV